MKKRKLGNTGVELTTVGFGAWAIGGGGWQFAWGPQEDAESVGAIRKALDLGVNWIDTAAVYGLGHSEEVVARAVEGLDREKIFIATKCGLVWDDKGRIAGRLEAKSVRQEAENSLRRLKTEYIDLYQIHWPNPDKDIERAWEEIAKLIEEGKVRHGGVSNFNVAQMERARRICPIASLQPPYSMIVRGVEEEILGYCAEHGIGVIAYSPMQCGLLTGKFTQERAANLPEDDFRRKNQHFIEPELSANLQLGEGLVHEAKAAGVTAPQLAVAWVLRRPEVTAAIVGGRNAAQVAETVPAGDLELSKATLETVDRLIEERDRTIAA